MVRGCSSARMLSSDIRQHETRESGGHRLHGGVPGKALGVWVVHITLR